MDCAGCIFAELEQAENGNDTQTGCSVSRLNEDCTIIVDTGFYKLPRVCNMKRGEDWLKTKCDPKYNEYHATEIARKEVEPTFGIVVYEYDDGQNDIHKTIESIRGADYNKNKITILWSTTELTMRRREIYLIDAVKAIQSLKVDGYDAWLSLFKEEDNVTLRDKECFSKLVNRSHWIKIRCGDILPKYALKHVDHSVNEKQETIAIFEDAGQTFSIIPASVARLKYLGYNDYDLMVDAIREESHKEGLHTELNETK